MAVMDNSAKPKVNPPFYSTITLESNVECTHRFQIQKEWLDLQSFGLRVADAIVVDDDPISNEQSTAARKLAIDALALIKKNIPASSIGQIKGFIGQQPSYDDHLASINKFLDFEFVTRSISNRYPECSSVVQHAGLVPEVAATICIP